MKLPGYIGIYVRFVKYVQHKYKNKYVKSRYLLVIYHWFLIKEIKLYNYFKLLYNILKWKNMIYFKYNIYKYIYIYIYIKYNI